MKATQYGSEHAPQKSVHKYGFLLMLIASLIVSTILVARKAQPTGSSGEFDEFLSAEEQTAILAATIQIAMFPEGDPLVENGVIRSSYARGLGSLVASNGRTLLVTHNHWPFLDTAARVEFRDSQGELLLVLKGKVFRDLVSYQDSGTLVLEAPIAITPAYLEAIIASGKGEVSRSTAVLTTQQQGLSAGQVVVVARHDPQDASKVSLLASRVESEAELDGCLVTQLRSLDGESIIPGDSGGGVWLGGKLVGNMWLTNNGYDWRVWTWKSTQAPTQPIDTSILARLPEGIGRAAQLQEGQALTRYDEP